MLMASIVVKEKSFFTYTIVPFSKFRSRRNIAWSGRWGAEVGERERERERERETRVSVTTFLQQRAFIHYGTMRHK